MRTYCIRLKIYKNMLEYFRAFQAIDTFSLLHIKFLIVPSWCQWKILVWSEQKFGYNVILMSNKVCFEYCSALKMYMLSDWSFVSSAFGGPCPDGKLYETGSCLPHCFLSVSLYYLSPWRDSPSTTHFSQNTSFSENVQCCHRKMTSSLHTDPETKISILFSENLWGQMDMLFHNYHND